MKNPSQKAPINFSNLNLNYLRQASNSIEHSRSPRSTSVLIKGIQLKSNITTTIEKCHNQIDKIKSQLLDFVQDASVPQENAHISNDIITKLSELQKQLTQGSNIQITEELNKQDKQFLQQNFINQEYTLNLKQKENKYEESTKNQVQIKINKLSELKLTESAMNSTNKFQNIKNIMSYIGID